MRSLWSKTVGTVWAVTTPTRGSLGFNVDLYETKADARRAARFLDGRIQAVPLLITSIDGKDKPFNERPEYPLEPANDPEHHAERYSTDLLPDHTNGSAT